MVSSRSPVPGGNPNLTDQEMYILRRLAHGANKSALANGLSISDTTLQTHLTNIYQKTQTGKLYQAVAWWWMNYGD